MRKPTRTISGVTPIAVMLPPKSCEHGACIYCPSLNSPQSYTPKSPVVIRAKEVDYDPFQQVVKRLEALKKMGHPTDKIELIIMGGTFLSYPTDFQTMFVKSLYDSLNRKKSKTIKEAKKLNEKANHRCVALCIETRPDICKDLEIKKMLEFGCTRVELGVQMPDDRLYKLTNRGHKVKDVVDATKKLKSAGFKVGYHMMPGLPGSSPKKDLFYFKKIFKDPRFKPDQIKIYPCQVIKGSILEDWYYKKKYVPYTLEETKSLLISILKIVPEYCRVMRIMREIPLDYLVAGILNMDLRKDVEEELRKNKINIKEIRFREAGFELRDKRKLNNQIKIKLIKYKASSGTEIFIQAVNKDNILFGLLRLRIEKDLAMVRELHVYGPALELNKKDERKFQHIGIGKKLLDKAEKLIKKQNIDSIKIISGVGVREYYEKLGYNLDKKGYMSKNL